MQMWPKGSPPLSTYETSSGVKFLSRAVQPSSSLLKLLVTGKNASCAKTCRETAARSDPRAQAVACSTSIALPAVQAAVKARSPRLLRTAATTRSCATRSHWSFMGPFETIDLNTPGGLRDYCERYGPFYQRMRADPPSPEP